MWEEPKRRARTTRIRVSQTEASDKFGHWEREFTARLEPWPVIEHWASENGYHLIAMKGGRRVYTRGERMWGRVVILDIRSRERGLRISAWIQVGWVVRLLTLFRLGAEQNLTDSGLIGVRLRRQTAQELNGLLMRFHQRLIAGTTGWHIADLPGTSLSIILSALALFTIAAGYLLTFFPGQLEAAFEMLPRLRTPASVFGGVFAGLFFLHHFAVQRRDLLPKIKIASAAVAVFALILTTGSLTFPTASTLRKDRAGHFCLMRSKSPECVDSFTKLTEPEREEVLDFLSSARKSMAGRSAPRARAAQAR